MLLALLALFAAACGNSGTNAVDTKVKAVIVAQQGKKDVSSVDCTDQAPAPMTVAGGGSVSGNHTCTVTFDDGQPKQVWAVNVLDLTVAHPVQLLYRVDKNATPPPPAVNVNKIFKSEFAVVTGAKVRGVHCVAGSPAPPSGTSSLATPDHVCAFHAAGHGRQRWAVRVLGQRVQILFRVA